MTDPGRPPRPLDPVPSQELREGDDFSHVRALIADDRASLRMGMEALLIEVDHAIVRMPVTENMVNGHQTMHGGFLFTLADSTFGLVCNTRGVPTVAAAADITFIRPAHLREVLRAKGRQRTVFGRSGITDVTVTTSYPSDGLAPAPAWSNARHQRRYATVEQAHSDGRRAA